MSLTERRRMLAQAGAAEQWDFKWDYTMGKLEEQTGWTASVSGSGSTSLTANGEEFVTATGSYLQVGPGSNHPQASALRRFTENGYGVVEAVMYGSFSPTGANLRITAAASNQKRITLFQYGGKWKLYDNNSIVACSVLADAVNNTEYKVRIVFKDTAADIYINGELAAADLDTSKTVYGSTNSVMHQNGGSGYYAVLKSLKIKCGRI
ncbi:MAG: hypothetical protein IKO51_10340 [Clostridia bacterium]|nr:hypothetical protein [Clostridia bacterium]